MNRNKQRRALALVLGAMIALSSALPVAAAESGGLLKPRTSTSDATEKLHTTVNGKVNVSALKQIAKEYNVPNEFLKAVSKKKTITQKELQSYAVKYKLPAQYVQRFFDNYFVFPAGSGLQYVPVDPGYPKNKYDFDNLVTDSTGEMKYIVNGKSKALKGIDVSEFQGNIDWNKVKKDGVRFAIIRVGYRGYGTGKLNWDSTFRQNLEGATAAGIPIGVYFYSQAVNKAEAVEEARMTLEAIEGYDLTYPVVIDMEDAGYASARTYNMSAKTATDVAAAFCETVKKAGYRPMVYSNARWFTSKLNMERLPYDKWLAQYYQHPFFPYQFYILQYTGKGRVNGIKGDVDLNLCFVNYK